MASVCDRSRLKLGTRYLPPMAQVSASVSKWRVSVAR
jgi:hypothetical protein